MSKTYNRFKGAGYGHSESLQKTANLFECARSTVYYHVFPEGRLRQSTARKIRDKNRSDRTHEKKGHAVLNYVRRNFPKVLDDIFCDNELLKKSDISSRINDWSMTNRTADYWIRESTIIKYSDAHFKTTDKTLLELVVKGESHVDDLYKFVKYP